MHATCGAARLDGSGTGNAGNAGNAGGGVPAPKTVFIHGAHRTTQERRGLKRASGLEGSGRLRASEFSGASSSPDCFVGPVSAGRRGLHHAPLDSSRRNAPRCLSHPSLAPPRPLVSPAPRAHPTPPRGCSALAASQRVYAPSAGCVGRRMLLSRQPLRPVPSMRLRSPSITVL
jgi:hypothetical protein